MEKFIKNLFILGTLAMGLMVGLNSCSDDEEKKETTAKDIFENGSEIGLSAITSSDTLDFNKIICNLKNDNGTYKFTKSVTVKDGKENDISAYSSAKRDGNKFVVDISIDSIYTSRMVINADDNTYSFASCEAGTTNWEDERESISSFTCIINGVDISKKQLTYKEYK